MMKRVVHILWFLIGIFIFVVVSTALDIGDDSECADGFGILTADGIWACANFEDIITWTNITVINNQTIYNQSIINSTYIFLNGTDINDLFINEEGDQMTLSTTGGEKFSYDYSIADMGPYTLIDIDITSTDDVDTTTEAYGMDISNVINGDVTVTGELEQIGLKMTNQFTGASNGLYTSIVGIQGTASANYADNIQGGYFEASAVQGVPTLYGVYSTSTCYGSDTGCTDVYSGYFKADGTNDATNVYGVYAYAEDGVNNYAAYLDGPVEITGNTNHTMQNITDVDFIGGVSMWNITTNEAEVIWTIRLQ